MNKLICLDSRTKSKYLDKCEVVRKADKVSFESQKHCGAD